MGIKDLRTFLKKREVKCFYQVPLHDFYGTRWGIDFLNWFFCILGFSFKNVLAKKSDILDFVSQEELYDEIQSIAIGFNLKLLTNGITPVWILDGISKDNKQVTKVERRNAKKLMIEKKENIIKLLKEMNPLERPYELVKELKQLMMNTVHVKREKMTQLIDFFQEVGIPVITAEDEAESLASSLAVERKISAVWSADTDTYPIGSPLVVKGFETINGELCINTVFTLKILRDLELNHEEFRDFCIMLGTDFNDRIPGIGPAKSYLLIKKYRNIETIDRETRHNCHCLKHIENRDQLSAYETGVDPEKEMTISKETDYSFLEQKYSNVRKIKELLLAIRNVAPPRNLQ